MWLNLNDLFYALMLPSGNDAAIVISENVGCYLQLIKDKPENRNIIYNKELLFEKLIKSRNPIYTYLGEMNKNAKELIMC